MDISTFIKKINSSPNIPLRLVEIPETGTWLWQWDAPQSDGDVSQLKQSALVWIHPLQALLDFFESSELQVNNIDFDEDDEDDEVLM
ncbi:MULTISPECIES: hypothetical protein [unclassified Microcoleus]|uniref:hypothetical protein n=1 Tax=unclassified Microcoleus TaxID=2642155 RepID=UPI002FD2C094